MSPMSLPRTQQLRAALLDAIVRTALDQTLPVPSVVFLEFPTGLRVELQLDPGNRGGVARWAAALQLPDGQMDLDGLRFFTDRHSPGGDAWQGACWVEVNCAIAPAGGA